MGRPRHPQKHLETVLREAEKKGWMATKGKRYFKIRCACGNHQRTVKTTPSDQNYERNLRGWLRRTGCWEEA